MCSLCNTKNWEALFNKGIGRLGYFIALSLSLYGGYLIYQDTQTSPSTGLLGVFSLALATLASYLRVRNIGLKGILSFAVTLSILIFPFSIGLMRVLLALPPKFAITPKWDRKATIITLSPLLLLVLVAFFDPKSKSRETKQEDLVEIQRLRK